VLVACRFLSARLRDSLMGAAAGGPANDWYGWNKLAGSLGKNFMCSWDHGHYTATQTPTNGGGVTLVCGQVAQAIASVQSQSPDQYVKAGWIGQSAYLIVSGYNQRERPRAFAAATSAAQSAGLCSDAT
jgi:hypothetical protein